MFLLFDWREKEKGEYDDLFKVWTSTDESADASEETNADLMKEKVTYMWFVIALRMYYVW